MSKLDESLLRPPDIDRFEVDEVRRQLMSTLFDIELPTPMIDRYRVLGVIGRGGMGTVYRAYDEHLQRTIAIKLIDTRARERETLLAEARAMARVDSDNVVEIFEAGVYERSVFITMELVDGAPLHDAIDVNTTRAQRLDSLIQAGRGLAAIHESGLIHRDFKPANVLVNRKGAVKIIDLGIALPRAAQLATVTNAGTLAYMSPEQLSGAGVTHRSDQFAFFVTLLEALTGSHPFASDTQEATARNIVFMEVSRPQLRRLPRWLRRVIRRGLSKDPAERFADMERVVSELELGPTRRRQRARAVAATAAVVVAAVALSVARARALPDPCEPVSRITTRYWNDEREAALLESRPEDLHASRWVASELDQYTERWTRARHDACVGRAREQLSSEAHAAINLCLDRRLRVLGLLVEELERDGDATDAANALAKLRTVESCEEREPNEEYALQIEDEQLRAEIVSVQRELDSARAYLSLGEFELARAITEGAVELAATLAYKPLIAEAKLVDGAVALFEYDSSRADAQLREAFNLANAHGPKEVALEAAARLVFVFGELERLPDEARFFTESASELIKTDRFDASLHWLLNNNRGVAEERGGEFELARAHFDRALGFSRGYELAITHYNIGLLEAAREDTSSSLRSLDEGLAVMRRIFGEQHSLLASFMKARADVLLARGDLVAARRALREISELTGIPLRSVETTLYLGHSAARLAFLERDPEAGALAERVMARAAAQLGEDKRSYATMGLQLGRVDVDRATRARLLEEGDLYMNSELHYLLSHAFQANGNIEEAVEHARLATAAALERGAGQSARLAMLLIHEGEQLVEAKLLAEARRAAGSAASILRTIAGDTAPLRAKLRALNGDIARADQP